MDIFVQSDDRKKDDATSLRDRADKALGKKFGSAETIALACAKWVDVRAFGQLFALPKKKKSKGEDDEGDTGISIPIRGPVTLQSAFSVKPVDVTSTQITKSVSGEGDGTKRGADTMGMKHRVDKGIYVFYGSMNPQLAEKTGFSDQDAEAIKQVLPKLFENDASSARPEGSMEVLKMVWWKHNRKPGQYSSAKVHRTRWRDFTGFVGRIAARNHRWILSAAVAAGHATDSPSKFDASTAAVPLRFHNSVPRTVKRGCLETGFEAPSTRVRDALIAKEIWLLHIFDPSKHHPQAPPAYREIASSVVTKIKSSAIALRSQHPNREPPPVL